MMLNLLTNNKFSLNVKKWSNKESIWWIRHTIYAVLIIIFLIINVSRPTGPIRWLWHWYFWLPITTLLVFVEGRSYFKVYPLALKGIFSMHFLIAFASHIVYIFSIYLIFRTSDKPIYSYQNMWEVPLSLITISRMGDRVSDKIKKNTTETYRTLKSMRTKLIRLENGTEVKPKDVSVGTMISVRQGETIPIDGIAMSDSVLDMSNITGESKNINVKKSDRVVSGSFNLGDTFLVKTAVMSNQSTLVTLIRKIEDSTLNKPKLLLYIDRIIKVFVPVVIGIALATMITWFFIGEFTDFLPSWVTESKSSEPLFNAIVAGVAVLAIACPCSLGLAVPLINTLTVSHASSKSIVINNADSLQKIKNIKYIVFDKTGTITDENFEVVKIIGDNKYHGALLALELESNHPIGKSIVSYLKDIKPSNITGIKNLAHKGLSASWDKKRIHVTTYNETSADINPVNTTVALYVQDEIKLVIELKSKIKDNVHQVITELKSFGYKTVMITGDNQESANDIAKKIGIDIVHSKATPDDKLKIITEMQKDGSVLFIGDGFNDALAIKIADISIAFGSGNDITNDIADISLLSNDFNILVRFIKLTKLNNIKIKESLFWASGFNIIAIPIAVLLLIQPWMAALVMSLSNVFIFTNALHYKWKGKKI